MTRQPSSFHALLATGLMGSAFLANSIRAQDKPAPPAEAPKPAVRVVPLAPPVAPANRLILRRGIGPLLLGAPMAVAQVENAPAPQQSTGLNTSEELERLLERAVQVARERPDLAPVLWQRILDEGASTFARSAVEAEVPARRNYEVYRPFSEETLKAMAASGPESLRQYRLQFDGPARALFARTGPDRSSALREIVSRYFLTTVGDEAAFELGCLALEQGDWSTAENIFARLDRYPDSTLTRDDIVLRRAVALSRLGRTERAVKLLEALSNRSDPRQPAILASVEAQASPSSQQTAASTADGFQVDDSPLAAAWEFQPGWTMKGMKTGVSNQAIMSGSVNGRPMIFIRQAGGNYVQTTLEDKDIPDLTPSQLAAAWRQAEWRPSSQPVVAGGRIYLKSESRTICCDAATGRVLWMGRPTRFPIDDWTRQLAQVAAHGVTVSYPTTSIVKGTRPKTLTEIMLFGDRLQQGIAVGDEYVLALEGQLDTAASRKKLESDAAAARAGVLGVTSSGTGPARNELACYHKSTGKLAWVVAGGDAVGEGATFLSTPCLLGSSVVVAIGKDSQLSLASLNIHDGRVEWKSTLSDLTALTNQSIPVGIASDEGGLYVSNGAGTLFSLDRNGGALRWAVSYPRNFAASNDRNMMVGGTTARVQIVLDENYIARHGAAVVVAPCDSDHVMAFDVASGSLLWDSPLPPSVLNTNPAYVVGSSRGLLVLGNHQWLSAIQLDGGRIRWDAELDASCGRGVIQGDSLFVPQEDRVVEFHAQTGNRLRVAPVQTTGSEPVGNLLLNGDQLIIAGAARLQAVQEAQPYKPLPAPEGSPSGTEQ